MKCLQNTTTQEIRRVSEDRALELTQKGWAFAPKNAWKSAPGTSWVKNSTLDNPMSDRKKHRLAMKNSSGRRT